MWLSLKLRSMAIVLGAVRVPNLLHGALPDAPGEVVAARIMPAKLVGPNHPINEENLLNCVFPRQTSSAVRAHRPSAVAACRQER
jgi:hypothetical protein